MKPFNPKAKCVKCGFKKINTYFDAKGDSRLLGDFTDGGRYLRDTLTRRCERCRYEWIETPLDAKKEAARDEA